MEFGEKMKQLRLSQKLTLEEVGKRIGVGKSTVRKWESGQIANMRRDKIALVAKALNTTPAYLMGWNEEVPSHQSPASDRDRVAAIFSSLTEENQKRLLDFARVLLMAQGNGEDDGKKEEK